jgi:hypothetical protein
MFCILVLAAALINPFGIWGLVQPLKLLRMPYALAVLSEWQSPNFQEYQPLELWIMVLFAAAFTFRWRLPAARLVMVLLLLHLALQHGRDVENLGLVAPLLLAPALSYQLEDRRSSSRILSFLDRGMAELAKPASALGILLSGALLVGVSASALLPRRITAERAYITPAAALAAVAAHHVRGPVFNSYGFGGYLIFNGVKTFIDGRADFYGDEFIKRWNEAVTLTNDDLPTLLKRYGITWTLLLPKEPAVRLLDRLPGWRRLYADHIAVVHVREDALSR